MTQPQGGSAPQEEPRVVIRDKRRIDPTSGAVRAPAGEQPAGVTPAPAESAAPRHEQGKRMSENETTAARPPGGGQSAEEIAKQLAERTEDLQRVTAEYANYRRRVDRDRSLVAEQIAERFAAQLFPIVDDIERARDHGDLEGPFKVVADRILALLEGLEVTSFGMNGDPFDPALHEAVMHDTSPDVDYAMITTVLRSGYRRGDRVLRTAMVAVTDPEPAAGGDDGAAEPAPATDQTSAETTDARASD